MGLTSSWHHPVHGQIDTTIGLLLPGLNIVSLCSLQGSYRCGPCKPGYIGDPDEGMQNGKKLQRSRTEPLQCERPVHRREAGGCDVCGK